MQPVLVAYIPVLHEGYRQFFLRHPEARELCLFGKDVIASHEHLVKDIRKLDPALTQRAIAGWNLFDRIKLLDDVTIRHLQQSESPLIISDDDLTQQLVQHYFPQHAVTRDTVFLRWDKKTSVEPVQISPDVRVSHEEFDRQMISLAQAEGKKSHDWWRRIGSLAVKDGKVILQAHNDYLPNEHVAYDQGDPRSNFKSGIHLESSLAIHAEARMVAQAAHDGLSLQGADIYCDTFPCPPCAKLLACSGIKRLYYRTGYKVLDGQSVLQSAGVEIIFVD